ncbi:deleted in malignant brain tumors 1 protein-like isoform X2 [Acanthaster planci]|uniref:Deleted in malignant brain tumors 1 protein-like isoform X2 n=1 Tax=Acanthaster planci TaxID=133434 RepID=A0A8B7YY29_ACAPL|nr:deleted in malignant brain tumors 1 protein-like isoform X2 [Acanthaster planci]
MEKFAHFRSIMLLMCSVWVSVGTAQEQEFDLRLVNGSSVMEGRVEMFYQGQWGTICHNSFGNKNKAQVACRQLGFSYAESIMTFGSGIGNLVLSEVACNGNEMRISDCYLGKLGKASCDYGTAFGVVCSNVEPVVPTPSVENGALRLVGGPDPYRGRVEVFIGEEGQWASICYGNFDLSMVNPLCGQLDYRPPTSYGTGRYGPGTGPIATCPLRFDLLIPSYCELTNTCTHDMDFYIDCDATEGGEEGEVRLVNGSEPTEGRVEIYDKNAWKTICADDLNLIAQQLVCYILDLPFPSVVTPGGLFGESSTHNMLSAVINCTSRETIHIKFCARLPRTTPCVGGDAAVQCGMWSNATEGDMRVSGGRDATRGRVEIYHSGQWGTVCSRGFDDNDANVICHQLGFRNQLYSYSSEAYKSRGLPVWLTDLNCEGREEHISECGAVLGEPLDCPEGSLGEVRCANRPFAKTYEARLSDGPYPNQGRLELLYDGAWGAVCDDGWDIKDVEVVCRQLGFPSAVAALNGWETTKLYGSGDGGVLLKQVGCDGTEENIVKCRLSYPVGNSCLRGAAGVVCFSDNYPSKDPRNAGPGLLSSQTGSIVLCILLVSQMMLSILI